MHNIPLNEEKKKREKKAIAEHDRLAVLFKKDRLAFERERKRLIDEAINSAQTQKNKKQMLSFQKSWDNKMKKAGSPQNRMILAQHLFWEHMKNLWFPLQKN